MNSYCTLFDSNYLDKGLAMYYSLKRNTDNFTLYVIAFDEKCFQTLEKLNLENMHVISLLEFENENLLSIKNKRSPSEYCWTCSSYAVYYVITNYKVLSCTYIDADLYFYQNPDVLIEEIIQKDADVGIIGHRFGKGFENKRLMQRAGKYCVQFNTFMNNENGKYILRNWMKDCFECCTSKPSKKGYGDQKYLDEWKEKYNRVHELENLGAGIAPWNLSQYKYSGEENAGILVTRKKDEDKIPLVFYHFHGIRIVTNNIIDIGVSARPGSFDLLLIEKLYKPYFKEIYRIRNQLREQFNLEFADEINREKDKNKYLIFILELLREKNIMIIFMRVYRYLLRKQIDFIKINTHL